MRPPSRLIVAQVPASKFFPGLPGSRLWMCLRIVVPGTSSAIVLGQPWQTAIGIIQLAAVRAWVDARKVAPEMPWLLRRRAESAQVFSVNMPVLLGCF